MDFDVKGQQEMDFSLEEVLWFMDLYFVQKWQFKVKTSWWLYFLQDINWWTGVWIIVMFLSAVWTLILTAPIHCSGSTGEQVMQCYISPNLFWWRNTLQDIQDVNEFK